MSTDTQATAPGRTKTVSVYPSQTLLACDNIHRIQRSYIIHNPEANQLLERASLYLEDILVQLGMKWTVDPKQAP
jgi:hypothetical protein